jgi:hypothetical protein
MQQLLSVLAICLIGAGTLSAAERDKKILHSGSLRPGVVADFRRVTIRDGEIIPATEEGRGLVPGKLSKSREKEASYADSPFDRPKVAMDFSGAKFLNSDVICEVDGRGFSFSSVPLERPGVRPRSLSLIGSGIKSKRTWTFGTDPSITGIWAGFGSVQIVKGDVNEVSAVTDDNLIQRLSVSLIDGTLELDQRDEEPEAQYKVPVSYFVQLSPATLAILASITAATEVTLRVPLVVEKLLIHAVTDGIFIAEDDLEVKREISLRQSYSGSMSLHRVIAGIIAITNSGSRPLSITQGQTRVGMVNIEGSGPVNAAGLCILEALALTMSASGSLQCTAQGSIHGSLRGSGSFRNSGRGDASDLSIKGVGGYTQVERE